jgi:hypothetical protein
LPSKTWLFGLAEQSTEPEQFSLQCFSKVPLNAGPTLGRFLGETSGSTWFLDIHQITDSQKRKTQLSGVVNRVAIWFYYRKAFATAFAVLSRAQFWLSRRDFFRNIFRGGFRRKYSS